MTYLGSTPQTQSFISGTDYFNGDGSTVAFTLSRSVGSVNDIEVLVNNVEQQPNTVYTVLGTTLTFTTAPSSGTQNIYVRYLSTTTQAIAPSQGSVGSSQLQTNLTLAGTTTASTITSAAATALTLQSAGTTAITVDASQNVGIGTASPGYKLDVYGNLRCSGPTNGSVIVDGSAAGNPYVGFAQSNALGAYFQMVGTAGSNQLLTNVGGTERMRIDSSGDLLVGTTTQRGKISNDFNGGTNNGIALNDTASASSSAFAVFYNNGSAIGTIARNGATSAVVYNTTSDQRLKSNIVDANPVLDKLMEVKIRQFDWTDGDLHQDAGFIAQELAPILSGIVTKGKTEEDYWQVDYSRLTPYLVKAIQEQQALITDLTTRLSALEAK